MSDDADRAQELQEAEREAGIAACRAAVAGGGMRLLCARCEAPIPAARRAVLPGAGLCVDCQTEVERIARLDRLAGIADA